MSRRKSRIPVFIQKKNEKKEFSPSLQVHVVFSIVDRSQLDNVLALRLENKRAIHRYRIFSDRMTNLFTHIDKCLLK
jgi:hypothetical protein